MAKLIDNGTDDAVMPETPYQGQEKPASGRAASPSFWGLAAAAIFLAALCVLMLTRGGGQTDPAPNGGAAHSGATAQPSPAQNSL